MAPSDQLIAITNCACYDEGDKLVKELYFEQPDFDEQEILKIIAYMDDRKQQARINKEWFLITYRRKIANIKQKSESFQEIFPEQMKHFQQFLEDTYKDVLEELLSLAFENGMAELKVVVRKKQV